MNVLAFLTANWDSVLVVVAFLAVVVVLIKRGETKILKQILFNLVTQAEKQFGSGTGSLKYAAVADWIYQRIPAVLKLLFTSSDIEKMIEAALEEAKKAWGANENLKGYIETPSVESLLVGIEEQAVQIEPIDSPFPVRFGQTFIFAFPARVNHFVIPPFGRSVKNPFPVLQANMRLDCSGFVLLFLCQVQVFTVIAVFHFLPLRKYSRTNAI